MKDAGVLRVESRGQGVVQRFGQAALAMLSTQPLQLQLSKVGSLLLVVFILYIRSLSCVNIYRLEL